MSKRMERANSQVKRSLSIILQTKMNDPRLGKLFYVSEVNLSPDFRYCDVKIAIDEQTQGDGEELIAVLKKSEGFIKRCLAEDVKMPQVPTLRFSIDKGTDATIRINEILKGLNIPKE